LFITLREAFEKGRPNPVTLDFDARVPIPFSVFPSSYRSDAAASSSTTQVRVEEEVKLPSHTSRVGREGHESHTASVALPPRRERFEDEEFSVTSTVVEERERPHRHHQEEFTTTTVTEDRVHHTPASSTFFPEAEFARDSYHKPEHRHTEKVERTEFDVEFPRRHHRRHERESSTVRRQAEFAPSEVEVVEESIRYEPTVVDAFERRFSEPREDTRTRIEIEETVDAPTKHSNVSKMGYYDDEGHYHSIRQNLHKAADRVLHPRHQHHVHEEVVVENGSRSTTGSASGSPYTGETVPIPCHHIRTGDILYLQGRPCQVIRISTSAQTGQHRYLGVDLFTKQLHEDTSVVSHPSPSVLLQSMPGPIFKQYRLLDVREDGRVVAMTESGDVKQSLRVADQGSLWGRMSEAFSDGRGSVRVLVLRDGPDELAVDFKLVHGSRL